MKLTEESTQKGSLRNTHGKADTSILMIMAYGVLQYRRRTTVLAGLKRAKSALDPPSLTYKH
jgi:hypothetical protein